jgi:hypothetical protein
MLIWSKKQYYFSIIPCYFCYLRHVIYAPAKTNKYAAAGFPSIGDAITSGNQTEINNQVAIATYFVRGALSTLKEFNKFIVA